MELNRRIKLNRHIRRQIADNVFIRWSAQNPKPEMGVAPTGQQLRDLDAWRERRKDVERSCMSALETFASVNQMNELWPAVMPFVPNYLINPEQDFELPEAA